MNIQSDYPLFKGVVRERHPWRPLGQVSDFVVEQLPKELAAIRAGSTDVVNLAKKCGELLSNVSVNSLDTDFEFRLALLDLLFLESGLVHSGGIPGEQLTSLVDWLSQKTGRIPALTYEDLVYEHTNPLLDDPRVFTDGATGLSERDFYVGQCRVESELNSCVARCMEVVKNQIPYSQVEAALREVSQRMEEVREYTRMSGMEMPPEHFQTFRQYLATHPLRGFSGPSGTFSVTFPTLEILVAGDKLPQEYYEYYEENLQYLPRYELPTFEEARKLASEGNTLGRLVENKSLGVGVHDAARSIGTSIQKFRGTHYQAVRKQIPEVLEGKSAGTGGEEDIDGFLRTRMRIRHFDPKQRNEPRKDG